MVGGKRDSKGKAPNRRVSIAPDEDDSPTPSPSPGPSTFSRRSPQESPATSHVSFASQSRPRPESSRDQPVTSASSTSAPASAPAATAGAQISANRFSALPNTVSQLYTSYWRPLGHAQGAVGVPFASVVNPFGISLQQPQIPPAPVNPPDELGPPPPPPPPPAIPPVVNPFGVHFQPQVPSTEMGPIVHHYVPRQDPVGAPTGLFYPGQQIPGFMANGIVTPMQGLPVSVAPVTAPMNPIVVQQPVGFPMMIQNHAMQGGPQLMLPGPTQPIQVTGNPSQIAGLPANPPVHVEPALGVGLTPNETMAQNIRVAQNNKAYEPQDFKPADPDPYRLYWFRELNGHWAVFPRRQIDRLDARWYRTDDGVFYAIRLSE